MQDLNLPNCKFELQRKGGKLAIFDSIRKKYIVLTPEEWVRQHFIHFLVDHLHYPKGLIKVESKTAYNQMSKRYDILIYRNDGNPWMIVECKAPHIKITRATLEQISQYNKNIKANFIAVTNGMIHYCWKVDFENRRNTLLEEFPVYV